MIYFRKDILNYFFYMINEPRANYKKLLYTVAAVAVLLLISGGLTLWNKDSDKDYGGEGTEQVQLPAKPIATTQSSFTAADVAAHNSQTSCYVTVGGNVYDLSAWIAQHPGGSQAILGLCGTDGTAPFTAQHGSSAKAQAALAAFKIGTLK